jgi:hypothetical protein
MGQDILNFFIPILIVGFIGLFIFLIFYAIRYYKNKRRKL